MSRRPPQILLRILTGLLPRGPVRDGLSGDLDELYAERRARGRVIADLWYARQLISAVVRYAPRRVLQHMPGRRPANVWDELARDFGYAFRMTRRRPAFSLLIVLTLALGIGANTAIFSVIDGVLLRPLPYAEPDRLVRILHHARDALDVTRGPFSREDFADLQQHSPQFAAVAGVRPGRRVVLTGGGEPLELDGSYVTADFFETLGARAAIGRTFTRDEHVPGADRVVVLSDGFWRGRFGGDRDILGRTITLDGQPHTVVGVMPPRFDFPSHATQLWAPVSLVTCSAVPCARNQRMLDAIARLAPTATLSSATSATHALLAGLEARYPDTNRDWGQARVLPLHESLVGEVRRPLLVLLGAVSLVLLITCANIANLLIGRGVTRTREFAIRTALGAGRRRVVRQLLIESFVFAAIGGALGLLVAFRGVDLIVALGAESIPRSWTIQPDLRLAGFALLSSGAAALLFGLLPSLHAARVDLHGALSAGGRSGADDGTRWRSRRLLITAEIAIAVVLLTGAGLFLKTFSNLLRVDTGLRADNVLVLSVATSADVMSGAERDAYRREMMQRIDALPGVIAVGGSNSIPLHGATEWYSFTLPPGTEPLGFETHIVGGDYFEALGIPVLAGRLFTWADEENRAPLVIVSQSLARRLFSDRDPTGERLQLRGEGEARIVGVVGDVRHSGITREGSSALYVMPHFGGRRSLNLFVRTTADPIAFANPIRRVIWDINPNQPVARVTPFRDLFTGTVSEPRFLTFLLSWFAALALILATLGVYGVTAFEVSRRSYEVGVRMACGARSQDVLRLLLSQGLAPVASGLAIGVVAALLLTRALSGLLFGVAPTDPLTFAGVALLLVLVAVLAVYVPARRAARIDPRQALAAQ